MTIKTVTLNHAGGTHEVPEGLEHCFIQEVQAGASAADALAKAQRLAERRQRSSERQE
jgi:hypothetical protein